ncbi:MAG: excinuclease ABC subunit A, partial [Myxococcales bacterium]|nr:excinuclease ABC subunit A [Myxococcales bacterium]
ESFSPYARQFLERLERPPMDELDPVAAGVAVDRRAPVKSSRSTVATMADLEAYVSALYLRAARPRCPDCGVLAEVGRPEATAEATVAAHRGERAVVTYPVRAEGVEAYLTLRESLLADGFTRMYVAGQTRDLDGLRPTEALAAGGDLDVVVDRVKLGGTRRLASALELAWQKGQDRAHLWLQQADVERRLPLNRGLGCPRCGRGFAVPRPGLFSYQSAVGACGECRGFGRVLGIDYRKVVPDPRKSLRKGAIKPWAGKKATWERRMLRQFCEDRGIDMDAPWGELPDDQRQAVIEGQGVKRGQRYPGIAAWFRWLETKQYKMHVRVLLSRYRAYDVCPACDGKRLGAESLLYEVDGLDLGDFHRLELAEAARRLAALPDLVGHAALARDELAERLGYLERVGLGYLSLDRQARTLSGGEAQRVSLTAALGSSLTGALFVLDEPTVGLHPTDLPPLVEAMVELARRDNVVVVVEHDPRVIEAADRVVELGPGAGREGGTIVFDGSPRAAEARAGSATAQAFAALEPGSGRRLTGGELRLRGVRENNLADLDVMIPLGGIVALCGPSGSGKSTLAQTVLHNAVQQALGDFGGDPPGDADGLVGVDALSAVSLVDQSPLGRTSRGNAATYSGVWTRIRAMFAEQPEAEAAELGPAHFSFNVDGGRCPACAGEGAETVEMQFLADVRLVCPVCQGRRFQPSVLEVKLRGRDVAEMLETDVDGAADLFADQRAVLKALAPLQRLGLGYLRLGQPLSTLSGGEAQR